MKILIKLSEREYADWCAEYDLIYNNIDPPMLPGTTYDKLLRKLRALRDEDDE